MPNKEINLQNPLKILGFDHEDILDKGEFGAVLARSGVGKTSFIVQLALNALLRNNNVLHISLDDHVSKVNLWYKEFFSHIIKIYDPNLADRFKEKMQQHRLIMTFKSNAFDAAVFEKRITDLIQQDIFSPQMVIIDGISFDQSIQKFLVDFKELAKKYSMYIWFTVLTHRHKAPGPDGIPAPFYLVADLFEVAIYIRAENKKIYVKALKGSTASDNPALFIDPSTMLLKYNE